MLCGGRNLSVSGGEGDAGNCDLFVVPDGFLTPGHKTGGLYLQPAPPASAPAPEAYPKTALAPQEDGWFYHQVCQP